MTPDEITQKMLAIIEDADHLSDAEFRQAMRPVFDRLWCYLDFKIVTRLECGHAEVAL